MIAMPQVRDTLARFVSQTIPDTRTVIGTRPLEALVIGAYVRGLSTSASGLPTGRRSMARRRGPRPNTICGPSLASSRATIRAPPPAWPRICRRSPSTSPTRCG